MLAKLSALRLSLSLATLTLGAVLGGAARADEVLDQADLLMKAFSWRESYEYLLPFESARAGQYEYDFRLGRSAFNAEMYEQAGRIFARMVAGDPKDALAHFDLGRTYFILGDYRSAKEHLETAKAMLPRNDMLIEMTLFYADDRLKKGNAR